jgi:hypothetical protein
MKSAAKPGIPAPTIGPGTACGVTTKCDDAAVPTSQFMEHSEAGIVNKPAMKVPAGKLLPNEKSSVSVVLPCASRKALGIVAVSSKKLPLNPESTPETPVDRLLKLSVGEKSEANPRNTASPVLDEL